MTPILAPEDFAHPEIKNRVPADIWTWLAGFLFAVSVVVVVYVLSN